ncbi:MAG: hypothetical protein KC505_05755 [Myxococcales bacterium]|nr:hypothetical protein [Myxococcales bacterium]
MIDVLLFDNEIALKDGDFIMTTDKEFVLQSLKMRLKTIAGECFMDPSVGIPWFSEILGQKRNERFIKFLILPQLEAVSGIKSIKDFSLHQTHARTLHIKFVAVLSDGEQTTISESIGVE